MLQCRLDQELVNANWSQIGHIKDSRADVTSVGPSSQRIKEFWYFLYFQQGIASFCRFFLRGISLSVNPNTPLTSAMTIVLSEFTHFFKEKHNLASSFLALGIHCMFFAFLFACLFVCFFFNCLVCVLVWLVQFLLCHFDKSFKSKNHLT